jgi:hypothetical protein
MFGEHFDYKNEITETADPDSLDVEFDYEKKVKVVFESIS